MINGGGDIFGTIIWFLIFFVFIFIYPRLMLSQLIYQLEQSAKKMEHLSKKGNQKCSKKLQSRPSKKIREKINDFTNFFVVEPSSLDPYGLVKRYDQIIRNMEDKFTEFVDETADKDESTKQEFNYGLRAAIGLKQIAKVVRHYVEMAKKYKNLQIAMMIKMQLPIIEELAQGELKGIESFLNGWPVGDSIGPMTAASLMENSKEIAEDVVYDKQKIEGRTCYIMKATGPEPHLGRTDEAIEKLLKKHKIARVITLDAGLKMEGEDTGSVAEGVGFAMGGISQREIIENVLLPKKIPLDSVVIKVGMTEAIAPMKKEIADSLEEVQKRIKKLVKRVGKRQNVLIIGVGNSSGIGNDKSTIEDAKKIVEKLHKKRKKKEQKKKKKLF